jgi:hypothetical protein
MPSEAMLEAARAGFPGGAPVRTEKESVHKELVRANVLLQNIIAKVPYDEDDVEYHDLRAIHAAVGSAQEFTR